MHQLHSDPYYRPRTGQTGSCPKIAIYESGFRGVLLYGAVGCSIALNSISFGRGVVRVSGIHRDTQHPECCTGCKGWLLRILLAAGRRPRWCCTRWTTRLAGAAARCRTAASLLPTLAKCYRSHGSWKPWHRVVAWRTSYWHSMRFRIW